MIDGRVVLLRICIIGLISWGLTISHSWSQTLETRSTENISQSEEIRSDSLIAPVLPRTEFGWISSEMHPSELLEMRGKILKCLEAGSNSELCTQAMLRSCNSPRTVCYKKTAFAWNDLGYDELSEILATVSAEDGETIIAQIRLWSNNSQLDCYQKAANLVVEAPWRIDEEQSLCALNKSRTYYEQLKTFLEQ